MSKDHAICGIGYNSLIFIVFYQIKIEGKLSKTKMCPKIRTLYKARWRNYLIVLHHLHMSLKQDMSDLLDIMLSHFLVE